MAAPAPVGLKAALWEALHTMSGVVGMGMIAVLVGVSVLVPLTTPYNVGEAWGNLGGWLDNPRNAMPEWVDTFLGKTLPRTRILEPVDFRKYTDPLEIYGNVIVWLNGSLQFSYDAFPSELNLKVWTRYQDSSPQVRAYWIRPDGETVFLFEETTRQNSLDGNYPNDYPLSSLRSGDPFLTSLRSNIRGWVASKNVIDPATLANATIRPEIALFAVVGDNMLDLERAQVLKGQYSLLLKMRGFSLTDDMDARFISYGKVYGLAGTDVFRRDLMVGLLWGAPIALAFGTAAALVAVLVQALLGIFSGWYGGRVDEVVQRASDFFLIIPFLPLLVLLSILLKPGLAVILLVVVALSVVGSNTKVVRSLVIQLKEEQFVEAARSYGASRTRVLFRYLFPRVMPYTFALIALNVPGFIFLEASLSFLGLGDPSVPTWGSILGQAYSQGALYHELWWWVAFPAAGILFTAVAFALLGYSFDKVLSPRLREE